MNTAEFTSKYYIDRRGSHSRKWDGEHLKSVVPTYYHYG